MGSKRTSHTRIICEDNRVADLHVQWFVKMEGEYLSSGSMMSTDASGA